MGAIRIPPPPIPSKLPFESTLGRAALKVSRKLDSSPPIKAINAVMDKAPYLPEAEMGTPFGSVTLPELRLPQLKAPSMTPGHSAALKASIGRDLADLLEFVPVVGPIIGQRVGDTYLGKINDSFTPEEFKTFMGWDKKSPLSSIAVLQTIRRK
jgi:hypothetical protein